MRRTTAATTLLILLINVGRVLSLGCMPKLCDGNDKNELRKCPDRDGSCGAFRGLRSSGQLVDAVDVRCDAGRTVYAPIDGEMSFWKPFGGSKERKCADSGIKIDGTGQWRGYTAFISSLELDIFGGTVKSGAEIGRARDRICYEEESQKGVEPHLQLRLLKHGKPVDPTHHLQQCMCTGQICESNPSNKLLGPPFKSDRRYNGVRGWDIECPLIEDYEGEDAEKRAPQIYAPISGEIVGRTRITFDANGAYSGCDNDGLFIVGTGEWADFEARLYNARYREDLDEGHTHIVQGEPIGTRLKCDNAPDSVFLEIRHQGRVVDISDMISAEQCKMPNLISK